MESGGKILTGAAATALLALVGHFATGEKYIAGLEETAKTELNAQGMQGVNVRFNRDPLSRSALLDGDVADDIKQKALTAVSGVAGVSSARWKGDAEIVAANAEPTGGEGSEGDGNANLDPATKAKVAKCQDGVDKSIAGKKLNFRSGSAYLSLESRKLIDEVAASLKPCSGLAIAVSGHTDDNGNAETNKDISEERAKRVRDALIERGISADLITATGYGSEKPLVKGTDAAADAQNRRINFNVQAAGQKNTQEKQGE